ncbi:hypothetical protein ABIC88_001694 [Pseudomonas kilonensis]
MKQLQSPELFQVLELVAYRALCDVQLLCRRSERGVPRGGFEGSQA